ncbi:MAG: DUF2189 domain-containing protein [Xanthomonadales bacterium]|jgi:uncharacterized membrane protein|nr:DUF2189 domain-containing protein [Xanthomonadales bacterium]
MSILPDSGSEIYVKIWFQQREESEEKKMGERKSESAPERRAPGVAADRQTLIAPCRDLTLGAPFRWLAAGWRDYWAVPKISLGYGVAVFLISALLSWLAWLHGGWILLLTLLTGFVFVAPLLAFALYSVPRQLFRGAEPSFRQTLSSARRPFQNAMIFGLILLVVFLVWARAGSMVHIFFPVESNPEWTEVLGFLAIGSAVGAVFATFSFAAAAFSLPMLANRDVDVVTAVISSIHAVMRNKFTAGLWAALIVTFTALGILTGLLGLILVVPWLAYASWHAYRDALDCDHWPVLNLPGRDSPFVVEAGQESPAEPAARPEAGKEPGDRRSGL